MFRLWTRHTKNGLISYYIVNVSYYFYIFFILKKRDVYNIYKSTYFGLIAIFIWFNKEIVLK